MIYELTPEKQIERLIEVLDYLKDKGYSAIEIAEEAGLEYTYLSKFRSRRLKSIPISLIETLKDIYKINPRYITHGSSQIIDVSKIKYDNFFTVVEDYELVNYGEKQYLQIKMDEYLYDFLVNLYKIKELKTNDNKQKENHSLIEEFIKSFLEKIPDENEEKHKTKDFVLLPKETVIDIARDNKKRRKELNEVIDILGIGE